VFSVFVWAGEMLQYEVTRPNVLRIRTGDVINSGEQEGLFGEVKICFPAASAFQ
jgi:hypothetical protein